MKQGKSPLFPSFLKQRLSSPVFIALLLFFLWLPYIILCFPGNLAWDTGTSILYNWKLLSSKAAQNNPYFQSWLFGSFARIGHQLGNIHIGFFIYCFLQVVLECAVIGKILSFLYTRWNAKWYLVVFLTGLYGLIPVFPIFAFSMGKDSNFGLSLLFFTWFALQIIDDPVAFFQCRSKRIGFYLTVIVIALLRNHAIFIALAGPWLFMILKPNRKKRLIKYLAVPTVGAVLVSSVIPAVLGIPSPQKKEDYSFPLQTTAIFVLQYPDDLSEEEKEIIESVIPLDAFKDYHPSLSDPLKKKADFTDSNTIPFMRVWLRLVFRHPSVLLAGFHRASWGYFSPVQLTSVKSHVQLGFQVSSSAKEKLGLSDIHPRWLDFVYRLDRFFLQIPIIGLLSKIGLYTILLLIAFVMSLKNRSFLLCTVPLLLLLGGCILSPVNGYYRYSYPYIVTIPCIFTGMICQKKKGSGSDSQPVGSV